MNNFYRKAIKSSEYNLDGVYKVGEDEKMWNKSDLESSMKILDNFIKELWRIDRVDDVMVLENALEIIKSQYNMLFKKEEKI